MKTHLMFYALLICIAYAPSIKAQSSIPKEYRGTEDAVARGVLDGNLIETNYRNHGEMSRWNDSPWGIWPKGSGGRHMDGIGFIMAGRVLGEKAQWLGYGAQDTLINPVIINYRQSGNRLSPYSGKTWGWLPLNGFNNPNRMDPVTGDTASIPATSTDPTSWPSLWPDRLGESSDAGWEGFWNGFRGKGLVTGKQETFYVMDDFSDHEYAVGLETAGPHSHYGVYYPSPSDSSIGGLGLQTEVRTFQFNDVLSSDILFTQYRTTNVSEKDINETWTVMLLNGGLGNEGNDDNARFFPEQDFVMLWDADGVGEPTSSGDNSFPLGYVGMLLLEHSLEENNGIDEDQDGIIDESKFNGPGELIEGKAAIEAYLESHYNMELFRQNYVELEKFPAYQNERWWTGDEDLDWVAFNDFIKNGVKDPEDELLDDVGRDGLGPNSPNYPGPDEGEGDGIPTQGEPNFGEQDMLEAENRGLGVFDIERPSFDDTGTPFRDDTWFFDRIEKAEFNEGDIINETLSDDDPLILFGPPKHKLKVNASSYLTMALIFGKDKEELMENVRVAKLIYESDYGQSSFYTLPTANEENAVIPDHFSLSQNYPNPFNPTTNIEFSLSKSTLVSLAVYDITGREVKTLISNKAYPTGNHTIQLNATDLSSGVYIYRLRVNGEVFTKKLTLIK